MQLQIGSALSPLWVLALFHPPQQDSCSCDAADFGTPPGKAMPGPGRRLRRSAPTAVAALGPVGTSSKEDHPTTSQRQRHRERRKTQELKFGPSPDVAAPVVAITTPTPKKAPSSPEEGRTSRLRAGRPRRRLPLRRQNIQRARRGASPVSW